MRVTLTARRSSLTHPTSKSGAKKRLIATHPKLEISLTPSNQRKRQFLIATKTAFPETPVPTPRGPRVAVGIPRFTNHDPRITAGLIGNGILECLLTHSKQSTGTGSNREKNRARFRITNHSSRLTNHDSRVTALTTRSPQFPPLRRPSLCYSHRVARVPPCELRASAPARHEACGSLPPLPAKEVILCAF